MEKGVRSLPDPPRLRAVDWFLPALIVIAALAAYWNSRGSPFFFDDSTAILENTTIRRLGDLRAVLSPPANGSGVTGRPVVNLSLALNYALGGEDPRGYHVTNIVFHALAGLLLFGIVRRTLLSPTLQGHFAAAAPWLAFFTALVWTLHPVQTESVTCVIQRTELLVGLFFLLTLYAFIRASTARSRGWTIATIAAACVGMATKEVMVTAPVLVLLYDRTFVAGGFKTALRSRRGLYAGLGASYFVLALMLLRIGGTRGEAAGFGLGATAWSYALKQCDALLLYLRLSIWPHPLNVFYTVEFVHRVADVWAQAIGLLAILAAVAWAFFRRPIVGFAGAWFFGILAPSSSIVPLVSQTVAEHRVYLSLAAIVGLLVIGSFRIIGRSAFFAFAAAAVAFGCISHSRNRDYRSDLAIWNDTVAKAPDNARAHLNLGAAWKAAGQPERAFAEFQEAQRLDPNQAQAYNNLATWLIEQARFAEAAQMCETALRLQPKFAEARCNLGLALLRTEKVDQAIAELQQALALKPDFPEAQANIAEAYLKLGRPEDAIRHSELAVRKNPRVPNAHMTLALAALAQNDHARALAALTERVQYAPADAVAQCNLGSLLYQKGDLPSAIAHYEAALRAKSDYADAHSNLGSALLQQGRTDSALEHFRAALALQPDFADAHYNLALLFLRLGQSPAARTELETVLRLRPGDPRASAALAEMRQRGN